jgi:hypothetical protein
MMLPKGLLDIFRKRPPIRSQQELAQFIDENAAFLVQKGIYEYSRARAGHYAKILFREPEFAEALDRSRWGAFPLGLAMVAEVVEGILRASAAEPSRELEALAALTLSVLDRYPVPASQSKDRWSKARAELARRLQLIGQHPPKRAFDIPEPFAKAYFDLMPIHKSLRTAEYPTLHNYLKVTLCNIHDELTRRLDAESVISSLQAGAR